MSAAIYSRLLGEFQQGFHESTDTRASVEIRSPGNFYRGREPSERDTVNYETEAVIASVAVPYSDGSDASTHAIAVTTCEYCQPPELLERFKQSCSEAGAILPLAIRSRLALDWEISRNPIACWMSLVVYLHGFTVRDADGRYLEHQLITNPWGSCADAIEFLRLNTDSPFWPDEASREPTTNGAAAGKFDQLIDESRQLLLNPNVHDAIAEAAKSVYRPDQVPRAAEFETGSGGNGTPDFISFDSLRKLVGVSLKTFQNAVSAWRKAGHVIADPCSYAMVRPLLIERWPNKIAVFGEFGQVQRTLNARK